MVTISGSGHFWSVAHVGRQTGIKIATKHSAFASQILDADGRHWARQPSACPHRSLDITTVSHMVEMEALTLPLVTWSLVPLDTAAVSCHHLDTESWGWRSGARVETTDSSHCS